MTKEEIRDLVLEIIEDIAPDEELDGLNDDEPLREQLDLDSMDFLDIVLELRKRHKIVVPEEDYPQLRSMSSTIEYLSDKL